MIYITRGRKEKVKRIAPGRLALKDAWGIVTIKVDGRTSRT